MTAAHAAFCSWFTETETKRLFTSRQGVNLAKAIVAYCVYENPFGRSGGIFAVAENYAKTLVSRGRDVVVVSPYHTRLSSAPNESDVEQIGDCHVPFGGEMIAVQIYEHWQNGVRWILMKADGYFEADGGLAQSDPYIDSTDPNMLLRDSLFASAAMPRVVAAIGKTESVVFHIQDWELAATAITVKQVILEGVLKSAAVVLTSHNPYDRELLIEELRLITPRRYRGNQTTNTVYQCMIPLMDAPVSTVSQTFAKELVSDPLQTSYFAGHLQEVFQSREIVGVDNGLFGSPNPPFSDSAIKSAKQGEPQEIRAEKQVKRQTMLQALGEYTRGSDPRIFGVLDGGQNRPLSKLPNDVPVFLMFGRLDPRQKGFDLLTQVIRELPRGTAKFVLTPIVASVPQPFLDDLKGVAEECLGDVVVYPFRMQSGYMETMAGASFAVMPSIYEPFGGATEPYLQGTPVVARASGGLVQQVADVETSPESATGILFREAFEPGPNSWSELLDKESPKDRRETKLYCSMVDSLKAAILQAVDIYKEKPDIYGKMLTNLFNAALAFSWDRAAEEYEKIYSQAIQ